MRKTYTDQDKLSALMAMGAGEDPELLAKGMGTNSQLLYKWQSRYTIQQLKDRIVEEAKDNSQAVEIIEEVEGLSSLVNKVRTKIAEGNLEYVDKAVRTRLLLLEKIDTLIPELNKKDVMKIAEMLRIIDDTIEKANNNKDKSVSSEPVQSQAITFLGEAATKLIGHIAK